MEMSLEIYKEEFEKNKDKALKEGKEIFSNDESEIYSFSEAMFEDIEIRVDDGAIVVSGSIKSGDDSIGYITLPIKMNSDVGIEILQEYIKTLNKVKTILEATK